MSSETVYLKIAQSTEVYKPDVYIKDIATVHCQNRSTEAKIKSIKVTSFRAADHKKAAVYVGSIMDIITQVESVEKQIQVSSMGQADFVIHYRPNAEGARSLQWIKTALIAAISFCGAAFAIMTFNNDASVTDVFGNIYHLVMGAESDGVTMLEFSYSLGVSLGILIFFNHFASWKLTVDPTPIEVEMRLYEDNVGKTLIQNYGRRERGIDVS